MKMFAKLIDEDMKWGLKTKDMPNLWTITAIVAKSMEKMFSIKKSFGFKHIVIKTKSI